MTSFEKKALANMKQGERVDSVFSVQYKKPVTKYKHGWMFEFRAADKTGQITVKYWGGENKDEVEKVSDKIGQDAIVQVRGTIGEYRESKEIAVNPSEDGFVKVLGEGEYDIKELIGTVEDIPGLMAKLKKALDGIDDPHYSVLLAKFFDDKEFSEKFSKCPASIMLHSAKVGGLVEHTLNVLGHCMVAFEQYKQYMDRNLLATGAILHDIGKVKAFKVTTNIDQTDEGILLGHVVMGMDIVKERISEIPGFPLDKKNKLLHIILSHHGRKEWGSPVEPATPEAQTVHIADDFDAKLAYITMRKEEAKTDDDFIWDQRFKRHIYLK